MDTTRASLLLRVRNRDDSKAWSEFDALYRPMLLRFATARGLNHADAEDVVQHCMESISRHIQSFEYDPSKGRFKGWLRTLVNNRISSLRRARRELTADEVHLDAAQDREPGPDETFDRVWREEHLAYCLRLVRTEVEDSTYRAFRAYVIQDQPIDSVCAEFKMSSNQVHLIKWRVTNRLRAHMRDLLGEEEVEPRE